MILENLPILSDNYVWILRDLENFCIIIDPGISEPIIQKFRKKKWIPKAILLTHNHIDHIGGVKELVKYYPKIIVFGPKETTEIGVDKIVSGGDKIVLSKKTFYVLSTPGHTLGHVSYYMKPYLFCGDTLFSGGCGRVYKEKYLDMYNSIKFISYFPRRTLLCCSHEYTLSNLCFARFILPQDKNILFFYQQVKRIRYMNQSSLPVLLSFEKKINLFLRTKESILKSVLELKNDSSEFEVFVRLRLKKNCFLGAKRD